MYPDYFGLKEPSFSITPDPQYLFLSQQHREALAHLLYGTGEQGGFVLLTGDVGTGKTTVCRAFLEQLPEHIDVALILNPALTGPELLQTICEELRIDIPAGTVSPKVLIDRLNAYLLDAHARGRRPVVLIDEAQNLAPEVLEQVRLLTNLETTKYKLLHIFLVGQPELRELLRGERLRQLDQRITARFHITPLHKGEIGDYVRHRLAVAGVQRRLFTNGALRRIYQLTAGVPRLINILCDRALLGAYATRRPLVNARIVSQAHRELRGEGVTGAWRPWRRTLMMAFLGMLIGAAIGWSGYWGFERLAANQGSFAVTIRALFKGDTETAAPPADTQAEPLGKGASPSAVATIGKSETALSAVATTPVPMETLAGPRRTVLTDLLRLWRVEIADGVTEDLCVLAHNAGLRCRGDRGGWQDLRDQDRPAMIRLHQTKGESRYALISALDDQRVTLTLGGKRAQYPLSEVERLWSGDYLWLWRLPPGQGIVIGRNAPPEAIRWLRTALKEIGIPSGDLPSGTYDKRLIAAVRQFQQKQGLTPDGIAGPDTLIRLERLTAPPGTPRLSASPP